MGERHVSRDPFASETSEVGVKSLAQRHGVDDFLSCLRLLVRTNPGQELQLVIDNYHTCKHAQVTRRLERHRRIHHHSTPTSASRMNQVEIWFSLLHRRGVLNSIGALRPAIQRFLDAWNEQCSPFTWAKPADQILAHPNRQHSPENSH